MNERHLSPDATTVYEALEDAGFVAGAINITCYRGRHRYVPTAPRLSPRRARPEPLLLLQPLRVGPDGRAVGRARAQGRSGRRVRGRCRALARDARRLRLPRLLPLGLRLRVARARPRGGDGRRARAGRRVDRRAARGGGRAGRVPRPLRRDPPRPTTARRRSSGLRGSSRASRISRARSSSPPRIARARSTSCPARRSTPPSSRAASTASRRSRSRCVARATRRSRGAAARTSRRASSSIPTRPSASAPRSRTRTPASCSSRRRKAGSSPTSAAATTSAEAVTVRSSPRLVRPAPHVGVDGVTGAHHRGRPPCRVTAALSSRVDERLRSRRSEAHPSLSPSLRSPRNWGQLAQVLRRRRGRLRDQPRRLRRPDPRRAPLPRRGGVLVPRCGHEQLHVEPPLDVPRSARPRRRAGDALLRRLARGARRQPRCCSSSSSRPG